MNKSQFEGFALSKPILKALVQQGYETPTDIQKAAIPVLLEGKDLFASAQTGTGKTAAFSLPMLQRLSVARSDGSRDPKGIRALILTPTRELALQIDQSLQAYGRHLTLRTAVILGGVGAAGQIAALRKKPDILVATPGRFLDLFGQGHIRLNQVEMLVLDEADRMLDMGFINDVRKIVAKIPQERQTMLFSATLPPAIRQLAASLLKDPVSIAITPTATVADNITQQILFVEPMFKHALLQNILGDVTIKKALVFARTKHKAQRLSQQLDKHGISSDSIHGNKTQGARQQALDAFDRGRIKVLVATDIMARGIDVDGITHVINYELPKDAESYVHRIGRTARAGTSGVALSFCDADELPYLHGIEKLTKTELPVMETHAFHAARIALLRSLYSRKSTSTSSKTRPRRRTLGRRSGSLRR
jgi:ATP-dependent RNA helicase RhlE